MPAASISYAITDPAGVVGQVVPRSTYRHTATAQECAERLAQWAGNVGDTVHVWMREGVAVQVGQRVESLPAADASAVVR